MVSSHRLDHFLSRNYQKKIFKLLGENKNPNRLVVIISAEGLRHLVGSQARISSRPGVAPGHSLMSRTANYQTETETKTEPITTFNY